MHRLDRLTHLLGSVVLVHWAVWGSHLAWTRILLGRLLLLGNGRSAIVGNVTIVNGRILAGIMLLLLLLLSVVRLLIVLVVICLARLHCVRVLVVVVVVVVAVVVVIVERL